MAICDDDDEYRGLPERRYDSTGIHHRDDSFLVDPDVDLVCRLAGIRYMRFQRHRENGKYIFWLQKDRRYLHWADTDPLGGDKVFWMKQVGRVMDDSVDDDGILRMHTPLGLPPDDGY